MLAHFPRLLIALRSRPSPHRTANGPCSPLARTQTTFLSFFNRHPARSPKVAEVGVLEVPFGAEPAESVASFVRAALDQGVPLDATGVDR